MAPSQISTLRVVLFTLTTSGALFGVMTSPVDSSIFTSSPFSTGKSIIEGYTKDIEASLMPLRKYSNLFFVEIKEAIQSLKTVVDAELTVAIPILHAAQRIKYDITELPTDIPEIKKKAGDTLETEIDKVITAIKVSHRLNQPTAVDSAKFKGSAEPLIKEIDTAINAISFYTDQLTKLNKSINSLIDGLTGIPEDVDITAIKTAADKMKSEFQLASTDATKRANTVAAISNITFHLEIVKRETNKLTDPCTTTKSPTKTISPTTAAPKTTKEAGSFSGFKLILVIVVSIIGGVVYCM